MLKKTIIILVTLILAAELSLAASDEVVCYHTFDELVCLDLKSGKSKWRVPNQTKADLRIGH